METTFDLCVRCLVGESSFADYFCVDCRDAQLERKDRILNLDLRDRIDTGAGLLICVQRGWPLGTTVEQVLAGTAGRADTITLTSDGRSYAAAPHDGPVGPIDELVYVERWSSLGREFHGYVHPTSRRIVQWG